MSPYIFVLVFIIGFGHITCLECPGRCICFHTTVRCMFLHLNRIPIVPPETTILDLRFNKIKTIPANTFQHLKKLNTLLFNNNHLTSIDNGAFNGLSKLKYLYLYKNKITKVEGSAFQGLESLEQLYIHYNFIEHLEPETFSKLPSLQRLFLHSNKLKKVPREAFKQVESLSRLRLDSNALVCDCELAWLIKMVNSSDHNMEATATCQYPASLQGQPITSLSDKDFHCRKPKLTEQPSDVEVSFGKTVYFLCKADGYPRPEITWLHNSDEILSYAEGETGRMSVLDDGTLMIEGIEDSDEGTYECMAKNIAGEVKSREAKIVFHHKQVAPSFVATPISQSVFLGTSAVFPCSVTGSPTPFIRWSRDRVVLGNNPHHRIFHNGTLIVQQITASDAGSYECFASNGIGRISTSANLIINGPPKIIADPENVNGNQGQTVVLNCPVAGSPEPTIVWKKEGSIVFPEGRYSVSTDQSELTILNVKGADQGTYYCTATNRFGSVTTSIRVTLNRRGPPSLSNDPRDVAVASGTNVELHCLANDDQNQDIIWTKNGNVVLTDNEKHYYSLQGNLFVHNVSNDDTGTYECVADNSAGFAAKTVYLSVSGNEFSNDISDSNILTSATRARRVVAQSINHTLSNLISHRNVPSRLLRLFRYPTPGDSRKIAEAAEIYEFTLSLMKRDLEGYIKRKISDESYIKLLSPSQLERIASLSGCAPLREQNNCDDNLCFNLKFRSHDGSCNNFKHALQGASLVPFKRLMPPIYENGYNTPVGWSRTKRYHGYPKPSARLISFKILSSETVSDDDKYSHMLMQWGQFLDHDLNHALESISHQSFSEEVDCDSSCARTHPCFPIDIPRNDPRIRRSRCMSFKRSSAICGSGRTSVFFNAVVPREQANALTSYIDASNVYGSSIDHANHIRNLTTDDGLLKVGIILPDQKPLLPFNDVLPVDCRRDSDASDIGCFAAGDLRVNEQLGLTSMHTLWMREHNRIASAFRKYNPHWDGDTVYHTARKLVGAQMQRITYKHWLPKIIGPVGMEILGEYKGYDSSVDSTISNVFATAAFRFGHSLINPVLQRLNASFQESKHGHMPLYEAFFAPHKIIEEGGIDPLLRGLFASPAKLQSPSQLVSNVLTERLFETTNEVALDLSAMNIQRGRDHAIPEYNKWRKFCNLTLAKTFDDLHREIKNITIRRNLQEVYGHPGNIDLFVGGMLEDNVKDSKLGPTFLCIIVDQFKRLRDGDRFWYENPAIFTPEQRAEIKKASLSAVMCENSDNITRVTNDLFVMPNRQSPHYTYCNRLPQMDLSIWMQCQHFGSNVCTGEKCKDSTVREHQSRIRRSIEPETRKEYKLDDLTEERLESLENVIENLQKSLSKLKRRVRYLERSNGMPRKSNKNKCIDFENKKRSSGEKWSPVPCKICECKFNKEIRKYIVKCGNVICPLISCPNPRRVSNQCCPEC